MGISAAIGPGSSPGKATGPEVGRAGVEAVGAAVAEGAADWLTVGSVASARAGQAELREAIANTAASGIKGLE